MLPVPADKTTRRMKGTRELKEIFVRRTLSPPSPLMLISFLHVSENLVTMFYGWDFLQRLLMHWFAALWPSPEANIWRRVHWHNAKQGWSAPLIPKETFLEKKKDQGFSVLLLKKKIMWPKLSKECNWYVSQWPSLNGTRNHNHLHSRSSSWNLLIPTFLASKWFFFLVSFHAQNLKRWQCGSEHQHSWSNNKKLLEKFLWRENL